MRSAATSEFDEDFRQSEQTGFDEMDTANDADSLDNGRTHGKKKVCTFSLLITMILTVYCQITSLLQQGVTWHGSLRLGLNIYEENILQVHSIIIRCLSGSLNMSARPATRIIRQVLSP
jgi:hypothetical protein